MYRSIHDIRFCLIANRDYSERAGYAGSFIFLLSFFTVVLCYTLGCWNLILLFEIGTAMLTMMMVLTDDQSDLITNLYKNNYRLFYSVDKDEI